jgi:hypothetical protein
MMRNLLIVLMLVGMILASGSISYSRGTPSSWLVGDSTPVVAEGFCYNANSNDTTWQNRPDSAVDCSVTLPLSITYKTKRKGVKTLSILTDTSCRQKFAVGVSDVYADDPEDADSVLAEFIETCYDTTDAWTAFTYMGGDGFSGNSSPASYANFREWLKSVLWLGPMYPGWYCACTQDIFGSYVGFDDGANLNAALAIIRYLDSSGRCNFDGTDTQILAERHMLWIDSVNSRHNGDSIDFPMDTTLPTIDDLGLQILRGPPAGIQNAPPSPTGIGALTASENPFDKETIISFQTGEYAYLSFQVFDVLGRVVQGGYKGAVQPPGAYNFTVDGTNLSSGVYYARITTLNGETRTIKIIKE